MTRGQICLAHEYCTNCPERKDCTVRPTFYSDAEYNEWREETLAITERMARMMGTPEALIKPGLEFSIGMMDKRRKKELELHKTYSPI